MTIGKLLLAIVWKKYQINNMEESGTISCYEVEEYDYSFTEDGIFYRDVCLWKEEDNKIIFPNAGDIIRLDDELYKVITDIDKHKHYYITKIDIKMNDRT